MIFSPHAQTLFPVSSARWLDVQEFSLVIPECSVRNRHYCKETTLGSTYGPEGEIHKLEQLLEHLNQILIDLKELRELSICAALNSRLFQRLKILLTAVRTCIKQTSIYFLSLLQYQHSTDKKDQAVSLNKMLMHIPHYIQPNSESHSTANNGKASDKTTT